MKATIFNIQKFSIHDGPGIRTIIFFKGCHLRCKWCCNPESQEIQIQMSYDKNMCTSCMKCVKTCKNNALTMETNELTMQTNAPVMQKNELTMQNNELTMQNNEQPLLYNTIINDINKCTHCNECINACTNNAIAFYGKEYTINEVLKEVLKDKPFYEKSGGGVTLSGGEALLQADFVIELCKRLHDEDINVAIETTLAVPKQIVSSLTGLIDYWLVDLKHYDSHKHFKGTNIYNEEIIENIKFLIDRDADITLRIAVIEGFNISLDDAYNFVKLIKEINGKKVELLPFHQFGERKYELLNMNYQFKGFPGIKSDDLKEFADVFRNAGIKTQIGG